MPSSSQLSPRAAIAMGVVFGAMGTLIMLMILGGMPMAGDTPRWVGLLVGFVFVLGGLAVIVGYAVAPRVAPDGDFVPGTPFGVRLVQYLLGLGIGVSLALVASWVAFGPGTREFGGSMGVGGVAVGDRSGETSGRVAFGIGAVLMWLFTAALAVVGFKRLRRR